MNYPFKWSGSICVLLLVGCTVGPNYQKPDLASQLPAHYQQIEANESSEATLDRWWMTFNDCAINQLVDIALSRNLDIASADANIKQARAQLSIINSASLPQFKCHRTNWSRSDQQKR